MGKDSSEIRREIDATRARMGDTVEALSYKADVPARVKDAVGDRVETVKGSIGDALGGARRAVASDAEEVRAAARRGVGIAAENPLGLAIGAAAVGFLAGLLVPVTEYERSTIGPIRDDLLERAQSAGVDALEHGKQVLAETAQVAMQTAQQSAQEHAQQLADAALRKE
jgi:ElaB/YqjD/DUF883 family membrane-anchored ribosome-binding protein